MSYADAPWSDEQVESLNEFQASGVMPPFTCSHHSYPRPLLTLPHGWECPSCDYTQTWAHAWMADGSWREMFASELVDNPPGN